MQNLHVERVDAERGLFIRGGVPGANKGLLIRSDENRRIIFVLYFQSQQYFEDKESTSVGSFFIVHLSK